MCGGDEVAVIGVAGGDGVAADRKRIGSEVGAGYAGGGCEASAPDQRAAVEEVHRAAWVGDQGGARCNHADGGGEAGRLPESGGVDRAAQRGRGVGLADNLGHSRRSGGVEVAVIGVAGGDGVAADRKRIGAEVGAGYAGGGCEATAPDQRAAVEEVHRAGWVGDQGGARCNHADGGGEAGRLPESGGVDRGGQRGRGVGLADNLGHSRRSGGVEVAVIGEVGRGGGGGGGKGAGGAVSVKEKGEGCVGSACGI